jgi:prepilin-type N-terminal cleavage/methylation domain-containing protein
MMRRSLSRHSTAGFTLIEMIVVIVIIGVLFAIAAPGWLAFANRQRANAARDQVLQAVRLAQSEAVRTHRPHTLKIVATVGTTTTIDPPTLLVEPTGSSIGISQQVGNGQYEGGMIELAVLPNIKAEKIYFDDRGNLDQARMDGETRPIPTESAPIKFVVSAPPGSGNAKTCVLITTLLGATQTASGSDCE